MTEALRKALNGNAELIAEVDTYETTATQNADSLQVLQVDLKTAVDKRQALKELVRKTTGLSELTEENLSKLGTGDEALKGEVSQLQEKIQGYVLDIEGMEGKHKGEINSMKMLDMLRGMGVDESVWNNEAFNAVSSMMLKGASYEDGGFIYKGEDGATVYGKGGKAKTVAERLEEVRADENVYQFKPATGGGAGDSKTPATAKQQTKLESAVSATLESMGKF